MAASTNRRSGYHHGDLRTALERAALALVAERGPQGFSLAEASRRAGVSVAAPFKHFAGREELLASLARQGYQEEARRFRAAVESREDPVEQLAEFAVAYIRYSVEQQALFEITFGAGIDKAAYPEVEAAGRAVLEVITAPAIAVSADPAEARALVNAVAATAHGYAAFLHEGVFGPSEAVLEVVVEQARAAALVLARELSSHRR